MKRVMKSLHPDAMSMPVFRWDYGQVATRRRLSPVGVWLAPVPGNDLAAKMQTACLCPDERERFHRIRDMDARRNFLFGRVMLRKLAGDILGVAADSLRFGTGLRGKPFLLKPMNCKLQVNISHTNGWVVVAMTFGRALGVDIEWMDGSHDLEVVAARVCSPRELSGIRSLPADQQTAAFYKMWTCKEAWLKATGEGLSERMSSVEVCVSPADRAQLLGLPKEEGPLSVTGHFKVHHPRSLQSAPLGASFV